MRAVLQLLFKFQIKMVSASVQYTMFSFAALWYVWVALVSTCCHTFSVKHHKLTTVSPV